MASTSELFTAHKNIELYNGEDRKGNINDSDEEGGYKITGEEVDFDNSEANTCVFDYIFPDDSGSNAEDETSLQVIIDELDKSLWLDGDMDLPDIPFIDISGFNVDIPTDAN